MDIDNPARGLAIEALQIAEALLQGLPPINFPSQPPTISGTPVIGNVLSGNHGVYTRPPAGYTYRWLRDGVAISGQTAITHTWAIADNAHALTFEETPTDVGAFPALSAPVAGAVAQFTLSGPTSTAEGNSGSTALVYTVDRSVVTTGAATVDWAVTAIGGTPVDAADFTGAALPTGTVSFADGDTSKTFTVNVAGDTGFEPDETFAVDIANPSTGVVLSSAITVTVTNDDVSTTGPTGWTVLDDFESTTGRSISSGLVALSLDSTRKVLGSNGLRLRATGSSNNPSTTKTAVTSADPANWDVIAFCCDYGDDVSSANDLSTLRPTMKRGATSYGYFFDSTVGSNNYNVDSPLGARGKRWFSFAANRFRLTNWAGAQFIAQGAGTTDVQINPAQAAAQGADIAIDAMVVMTAAQAHKPIFMLTWDDVNSGQAVDVLPAMTSRGLVGSAAICDSLVGNGGKLSWTQLRSMQAAGWKHILDSGPNDEPVNGFGSVAAFITAMNSMKTRVDGQLSGYAGYDAAGLDHLVYSFGNHQYPVAGSATQNITGNGTNGNVTIAAPLGWGGGIYPGMYVRGTGIPAGTTVVTCGSQTALTLSNTIPSGVVSATFFARARGQTVTATGTPAITVTGTSNIVAGMKMVGYTVPAGTTVVSVDSGTTLTMSAAIPATCVKANFELDTGEFYGPKVHDALLSAGYKSARNVAQVGGVFTGFGIDPKLAINMPGVSVDTVTGLQIAYFETALAERRDLMCYGHYATGSTMASTNLATALDWLQTKQNAGLIEVLTVPDWYNKVSVRPGIS